MAKVSSWNGKKRVDYNSQQCYQGLPRDRMWFDNNDNIAKVTPKESTE